MTRILSSAPFRTLFILLVSIAASAPVAFSQSTDDTIRVETNLVSVPVVVSDRQGRYVTGLKSADFTVIVDGKEVETAFFASENAPLRVAVLLDTSKSTDAILGKIKRAAREFVKTSPPTPPTSPAASCPRSAIAASSPPTRCRAPSTTIRTNADRSPRPKSATTSLGRFHHQPDPCTCSACEQLDNDS